MNSLAAFSVWFSLLRLIHRCESKPPLCKQGMFYEESVFAYFSCNLCVEQSHYTNCERCCGSSKLIMFCSKNVFPIHLISLELERTAKNYKFSLISQVSIFEEIVIALHFYIAVKWFKLLTLWMKSREMCTLLLHDNYCAAQCFSVTLTLRVYFSN